MFLGTIYGLYSPAGELRYIGQTARPLAQRISEHLCFRSVVKKIPVVLWIEKLRRQGLSPVAGVLATAATADELARLEIAWIADARASGVRLLNLGDGGSSALGVHRTEEMKAKLRALVRPPRSEAYRRRLGNANRGRKFTGAWLENIKLSRRRGEEHPRARLTAEDVRVIRKRSADGELGSRLAREYRVSESLISKIKARSIWK